MHFIVVEELQQLQMKQHSLPISVDLQTCRFLNNLVI
jgi:hypothetical protein